MFKFSALAAKCWMCESDKSGNKLCEDPFNASKFTEDEKFIYTYDCGDGVDCLKMYMEPPLNCEYSLIFLTLL